jgi:predicted ATPase with chaperone activity
LVRHTIVVIVGLPDVARDRVSTALTNSGFKSPMG